MRVVPGSGYQPLRRVPSEDEELRRVLKGPTELAADPTAVRSARRLLVQVCQASGTAARVVDVAELLVSELVTNAVLHGRSRPRLTVTPTAGGGLSVGVGDDNSRLPVVREDDRDALDGRGLRLLDLLSSRWGVRPDPPGKVVWFELDPDAAVE